MGRPRAIQGKVEEALLEALGHGLTKRLACELVGISTETLREECERNPAFAAAVTRERLKHIPAALDTIREAAPGDWRAAKAFLELVAPDDFGRQRIEISGPAGTPLQVEVGDARERLTRELDRLAERHGETGPPGEADEG